MRGKLASAVRWGADGKGQHSTSPAAYPTPWERRGAVPLRHPITPTLHVTARSVTLGPILSGIAVSFRWSVRQRPRIRAQVCTPAVLGRLVPSQYPGHPAASWCSTRRGSLVGSQLPVLSGGWHTGPSLCLIARMPGRQGPSS
jgi:hypothetical protein